MECSPIICNIGTFEDPSENLRINRINAPRTLTLHSLNVGRGFL